MGRPQSHLLRSFPGYPLVKAGPRTGHSTTSSCSSFHWLMNWERYTWGRRGACPGAMPGASQPLQAQLRRQQWAAVLEGRGRGACVCLHGMWPDYGQELERSQFFSHPHSQDSLHCAWAQALQATNEVLSGPIKSPSTPFLSSVPFPPSCLLPSNPSPAQSLSKLMTLTWCLPQSPNL